MSSHPTFHTPSFGDEEFHIPSIQNNSSLSARGDINVSGSRTSGVQAVTNMTTTNINSSAADTHSATETNVMSNFNSTQWPTSYQASSMQSGAGVVTVTGNDFLVLRSPHQQQQSNSGSDIANSTSLHMTAGSGVVDQGISSDEDDDGSLSRAAGNHSPGGKAAIVGLKSKFKNDPNAPRKPVSAYALFFGDTQAAIKGQNPNASFTEVSKIVASMWDVLAPEHKEVYKKKADDAKKDYRRLMSTYLSSLIAKGEDESREKPEKEAAQQPQAVSTNTVNTVGNTVHSSSGTMGLPSHRSQSESQTSTAATTSISNSDESNDQGAEIAAQDQTNTAVPGQTCIRNGCQNQAIVSPDWEDEYCSNECVVSHCAEIFSRWVQDNSGAEA